MIKHIDHVRHLLSSDSQGRSGKEVKEPGTGIKHGGRSVFETGAENAVEIEAKAGSQEVETVAATIEDVVPVRATTFHTEIAFAGTPASVRGTRCRLEKESDERPKKRMRQGNEGKKGGGVGNDFIPPDAELSSGSTERVARPQAVRTIQRRRTFTVSEIKSLVDDAERS